MSASTSHVAPGQRAQHFEAGAHRTRIGIVGIVDDPAVAQPRLELQPAGHGAKIRKPRRDVIERCAGRARRARRAERIGDVVRAAGLEHDRALAERTYRVKRVANSPRSIAWTGLFAVKSAPACTPKVTMRPAPRDTAPIARIGVVGIDDRGGGRARARRPSRLRPWRRRRDRRSPRDARRRHW